MEEPGIEMTPALESWRSDREDIFDRFCEELMHWSASGQEPSDADQDVRFALDLQEKRLREHKITMEYTLTPTGAPPMQTSKVLGGAFSRYMRSVHYRSFREELAFRRASEVLYRHKKDVTLYQSVFEPREGEEGLKKQPVCCPSCGGSSTVGELTEEGCPWCRTRFLFRDLYPKVTNYYLADAMTPPEEVSRRSKRYPLIGAAAGGVLALLSGILAGWLKEGVIGLLRLFFSAAAGAAVWAFLGYMIYSLSLLFKALFMAGKSLPMLGALGGNRKLDRRLSVYDPSFSAEYFTAKAVSLFRAIAFSRDPEQLPQYSGGKPDPRFADLIHSSYKGAAGVKSIDEKDGWLSVELELFLRDYYDTGNRVKAAEDRLLMKMRHRAEFRVDEAFTLSSVRCHSCGGSFNALQRKNCPYCGNRYESARDDWEVVSLEYR